MFFVNVPIVTVGVLDALVLVPDAKNLASAKPDPVGAVLSVVGLGLVLWAVIEAPSRGWGSPSVVGVGAAGLAVLLGFLAWEAHSDHPMLNLGFYRSRRLSAASGSVALGVFALFGALFVQTQFLQFCLGYSPLQAGVRILPTALALAVTSPLTTLAVKRIGSRLVAAFGSLAIAAGLLQIAAVASVTTRYADVLPGMFLLGMGAGLLMPTATDAVMGSVPRGNAAVGAATMGVSVRWAARWASPSSEACCRLGTGTTCCPRSPGTACRGPCRTPSSVRSAAPCGSPMPSAVRWPTRSGWSRAPRS